MPNSEKRVRDRARNLVAVALASAALAVGGAARALAASPQFPALIDPASQEQHVGKMIFAELTTPELAAAQRFYGGLVGWTFQNIGLAATPAAEAIVDGQPVALLVEKRMAPDANRRSAWLTFLAVPDADAASAAAARSGGRVLFGPSTIPNLGRKAVLADPQGAVFAILASSSGDPPDALAAPGEWIWSSLITSDPDAAAAFYQTLFDYQVFDLPGHANSRHLMLASGDYARASVNPLPSDRPDAHPRWINFIRVGDTSTIAMKAASLGGRVLVPPHIDRHGGKIAVVLDPMGALFGLMEWVDQPDTGQAK